MPQASEIARILTDMGNSAGQVANTLRVSGIQGVPNAVRFLNPIIRYCQAQIRIDSYALDLMQRDKMRIVFPDLQSEEYTLPPPVMEFLDAFNRGAFPDLELPSTS